MKKIQLKKNHLILGDKPYIQQYLGFLGIKPEHINSFIDAPSNADEDEPWQLNNIRQAVEIARLKLNQGAQVFVQVDSDTDGYTSAAILINYLKRRYPNVKVHWRLHKGKEHGILVDTVPAECDLVFIPDAGSNQFAEQRQLVEQGKTVIILDHHEVTNPEDTPAIIVNNQLSASFENKSLSGAGVVYMFIKAFDACYYNQTPIYADYRDLAAIGIIADAMNMTTIGNNFLAYYGLNNIHSELIHELAIKQARGIKDPDHLTKIDVAFYIAPVINGCIRSGTPEDKQTLFNALVNEHSDERVISTWRGVSRNESLYEHAVRLAANAKSRQDSAKKKAFEWLCETIKAQGWDKHNVIIVPLLGANATKVTANITGLVAMELVKEFNKPALVLRDTEIDNVHVLGGSGRNGTFFGLPDFKAMLNEAGAYYAEGHANAFGAYLLPDQVDKIRDYFDTQLDAATFNDTVYEVDYWFHTGETIDSDMLMEFAQHDALYGNSIPQPKFAMEVTFSSSDIMIMGKDRSSVKIKCDGIDFVSFKNPALVAQIEHMPSGRATIVGRPQLNEWMGRQNVQIMIDDIEIHNAPEPDFFVLTSLI